MGSVMLMILTGQKLDFFSVGVVIKPRRWCMHEISAQNLTYLELEREKIKTQETQRSSHSRSFDQHAVSLL